MISGSKTALDFEAIAAKLKRDGARFSEQEDRCITAMLEKRIAEVDALVAAGDPAAVADMARPMPHDLSELSSVDLMHCALGVET